jgi:2-oxoglutarate ferredoxin oxidoreductase subunit delta
MRFWRTPLDTDSIQKPRGEIHLLPERCKGCRFCVIHCPQDVLVMTDRLNAKGYHLPEVAAPDRCVACGLCELLCPEFAIYCLESAEVSDEF